MKNFSTFLMSIFTIIGCSNTYESQRNNQINELVTTKSTKWCQENYYSASISSQQRTVNSKYCDEKKRQQAINQITSVAEKN
ncbi:hypothetical protein [Parashewanella tropica]|uniref:hypothetical protein n=1 Tax=Parashewanella tropica TaxID=2547970 RepID=UPI001059680E|nr:hypothetical protein [Parashewanella tropica]